MSEQKRVVIREELAGEALTYLRQAGLEVVDGAGWSGAELLENTGRCHGLILGPADIMTADALGAAGRLEVVGRRGVSVDNIDVAAATRRGIVVVNTPQSNVVSAAEQAIAMVLACARNLAQNHADLRAGRWVNDRWAQSGVEVRGKTLGLIGLGRVGALFAQDARALGMNVLAYDPFAPADRYHELALERVDDTQRIYAESDFVAVHLPDTAETRGFIGAGEFAGMKDGVRVVNLSRPSVIDQAAWLRAIESGKVAASAVTVYESDAATASSLARCDNVLFAAHLETSTADARLRAGMMMAEQIAAVLAGQLASSAVNLPAIGDDAAELVPYMGLCRQLGRLLVSLADRPAGSVEISYGGTFAYYDTRILTLGVLEGVLADAVAGRVNYVNAQSIADERGVAVKETRQSDVPDFPSIITVSAADSGGEVSVSGTSLGSDHKPRLVRVFGEDVDIEPAPHMLFLRYLDRPGVGGAVGTMLGEWGVNIGHMSVGRGRVENEAVMALALDEPLSAGQLGELVERCQLENGRGVELT